MQETAPSEARFLVLEGAMDLTVRPASRDDLAAVDALLARSYPKLLKADYAPSVLVTALPLISKARAALFETGTYYVALLDGEVVGAGGWTRDRRRRAKGHVRHVVTDFRRLRQGIGRAVMDRTLAEARAAGVQELECWSTFTAVPFYRAMGFAELGPMQVELAPGIVFPSVRMVLRLG